MKDFQFSKKRIRDAGPVTGFETSEGFVGPQQEVGV